MPIEKAFAINAPPEAVWSALMGELASVDQSGHQVVHSVPNEVLSVSVQLQGGVPATITYHLIPRVDHTEVVATMAPSGLRYGLFRIFTLGHFDTNYQIILVQGLANLKAAVEGTPPPGNA